MARVRTSAGEGWAAAVATALVGAAVGGFAGYLLGLGLRLCAATFDDTGLGGGLWPMCGAVAGALVGAPCLCWIGSSRAGRGRRD